MSLHPKADADISDSERSCISARAVGDGQRGGTRSWFCARHRLVPLASVVLSLLGVEFATLRITHLRHFSKVSEELKALQGKNAALLMNLTALKSSEHRSEEQLALMESEMRLRTVRCGDLKTEMQLLQEENAKLRGKVSRLVAEQAVASKELGVRRNQFEALSAEAMVLREENGRLRRNVTRLEDDLHTSYQRFINMSSDISQLRETNGVLRANLTADREDVSTLVHFAADESQEVDALVSKNSALRRNLSKAELAVKREKRNEKFSDEELHKRYRQFIGMSQDVELLRSRNAILESEQAHRAQGLSEQRSSSLGQWVEE